MGAKIEIDLDLGSELDFEVVLWEPNEGSYWIACLNLGDWQVAELWVEVIKNKKDSKRGKYIASAKLDEGHTLFGFADDMEEAILEVVAEFCKELSYDD